MNTKLTLRIDSELIDKAKRWSKDRNISLSKAVANFFENMDENNINTDDLSPWAKGLIGSIKLDGEIGDYKEVYGQHLEEKYLK